MAALFSCSQREVKQAYPAYLRWDNHSHSHSPTHSLTHTHTHPHTLTHTQENVHTHLFTHIDSNTHSHTHILTRPHLPRRTLTDICSHCPVINPPSPSYNFPSRQKQLSLDRNLLVKGHSHKHQAPGTGQNRHAHLLCFWPLYCRDGISLFLWRNSGSELL